MSYNQVRDSKYKWGIVAGGIALCVFMITNPTFMMSADASVIFGLHLYIMARES